MSFYRFRIGSFNFSLEYMSRRKQYKILARQTAIHDTIVSELQKNPELADYDMETIEISVKKKITPRIRNIVQNPVKLTTQYRNKVTRSTG